MQASNRIRILCLSFWTPPVIRPQAILIGKMIHQWALQGMRPVIMTYDICGDWKIGLPIYKIPQFSVSPFLNKIKLITILEYFYYRKLFKVAKKIIKEHKINLIFSFANPQASNILGAMIRKKLGIKFISHFSDPWYDNPYKKFSWLGAKKVLAQETYIVKYSDRVIFITDKMRDLVMKKYPSGWRSKAVVIPHCYDLQDYPDIQNKNEKFTISYIGAFYSKRNPEIIFEALRQLSEKKEFLGKFKLRIVGGSLNYATYKEDLEKMIKDYGLENSIELIPAVDYKKSLEYMKLSDCLLVIDADFPNSPFLTSKVVDYAGSGTMILGITPKGSPTADFLTNLGYVSFAYNQLNELEKYLENIIIHKNPIRINYDFLKQFDVAVTTAKLIQQFNKVLQS